MVYNQFMDTIQNQLFKREADKIQVSPEDLTFYTRLNRMAETGFPSTEAEQKLNELDKIRKDDFKSFGMTDYLTEGMTAGVADLVQQAGGLGQILGIAGASEMAAEARRVQQFVTPDFDPQQVDTQELPYEAPSWWQKMAFLTGRVSTAAAPALAAGAATGAAVGGAVAAKALTGTQGFALATGAGGLISGLQAGTQTYDEWLAKTGDESLATKKGIMSMMAAGAITAAGGAIAGKWMGNATTERLFNGILKDASIRTNMTALGKNMTVQALSGALDAGTQNLINELPAGHGVFDAMILSAFLDPTNFQLLGRSGVQLLRGKAGKEDASVFLPGAEDKLASAIGEAGEITPTRYDNASSHDAANELVNTLAAKQREGLTALEAEVDKINLNEFEERTLKQQEIDEDNQIQQMLKMEADDYAAPIDDITRVQDKLNQTDGETPDKLFHVDEAGYNKLRLPIEPVQTDTPGAPLKPHRKIVADLKKNFNTNLFEMSKDGSKAFGYYAMGDEGVRTRKTDLSVLVHEVGHQITESAGYVPNDLWNEIVPRFSHTAGNSDNPKVIKAETMAELVRAMALSPEGAARVAPKSVEFVTKTLGPEKMKALTDFGESVRRFYHAKPEARIQSQVWKTEEALSPTQTLIKMATDQGFRQQKLSEIKDWAELKLLDDNSPLVGKIENLEKMVEAAGVVDLPYSKRPTSWFKILQTGHKDAPELVALHGSVDQNPKTGKQWFPAVKEVMGVLDPLNFKAELDEATTYSIAMEVVKRKNNKINKILDDADALIEPLLGDPANDAEISRIQEAADALVNAELKKPETGSGGGFFKDIDDATQTLKNYANLPSEKRSRILAFRRGLSRYYHGISDMLVDAGVLDAKKVQQMKAKGAYMPLNRLLETNPGEIADGDLVRIMTGGDVDLATGKKQAFNFTKQAKGSAAPIMDPIATAIAYGAQAIKSADKARFMRSIHDLGMTLSNAITPPGVSRPDVLSDYMVMVDKKLDTIPANAKVLHVDGQRWVLNNDFADALEAVANHAKSSSALIQATAKFTDLLRSGIVLTPAYAVKNATRDYITRYIQTGGASLTDMAATLRGDLSPIETDLRRFGVTSSGHYNNAADYAKLQSRISMELDKRGDIVIPLGTKISNWWDKYKRMISKSEMLSRVPEYKREYAKYKKANPTHSDMDARLFAATKSLDLIDFNRAGEFIRDLNKIVPFTNAAVQGLRRSFFTLRDDPRGVATRAAIAIGMFKAVTFMVNAARGDLEEYESQPSYMRDMFASMKVGDNLWIRIPLPFDYAVLGSFFERGLSAARGNKNAFEGYQGSLASALIPVDEAAMAGPLKGFIEMATNYDFFKRSHIIPPTEAKLELGLRPGTESASTLGRLGQEIFGVDARQLDHGARAFFGTGGHYITQFSDLLNFAEEERQARSAIEFLPALAGVLSQSPAFGSPDAQYVMKTTAALGLQNELWYKQFMHLMRESLRPGGGRADIDARKKAARQAATDLRLSLEAIEENVRLSKQDTTKTLKELRK